MKNLYNSMGTIDGPHNNFTAIQTDRCNNYIANTAKQMTAIYSKTKDFFNSSKDIFLYYTIE